MVYVVERYLPGLSRSDLLHGSQGSSARGAPDEARAVRYLGSTIVLGDEACYCQFEGPSEAAVAEANRKAGLPSTGSSPPSPSHHERRTTDDRLPVHSATVQIRRSHLLGVVVAAVALVAAAVTWAVTAFAVDTATSGAVSARRRPRPASAPRSGSQRRSP